MQLPLLGDLGALSTRWKAILDPFLAKSFLNGQIIKQVVLINGTTVVNHKLGRVQQGWAVVDSSSAATIYRSQPFNDQTLTLVSNAAVTVNLWVF